MRPLELRVRNFRSYAGEHEFNFAGRRLVAIVGPIGSGKSSILDAIVYALYGRTPRIARNTKALINQRAADAAVSLRFDVEGELWEATRSIRIKGASRHALYRYEDPDGEPVEKLTMEAEVNAKIVELLGLDYSAFERSVLLAQGRFAEFLQAPPADRDRVLKGVFGHDRVDRMRVIAKERRDQAELELEKINVRLERFEEIRDRLESNRRERDEAKDRLELLTTMAEQDAELKKRQDETQRTADEDIKRLAVLNEQAERLPEANATARSIADAGAAAQNRADLAASLDQARHRLQVAEASLHQANEADEPARLERASGLMAAAEPQLKAVVVADRRIKSVDVQLDKATGEAKDAGEDLHEAEKARDHTLGRAVEAAKILDEAEAAMERGRHADMAATLRAGLEVEEPCPVCRQIVVEMPEVRSDLRLDELEEVLATARRAKADVDQAHTEALTVLERARARVESTSERVESLEAQLAAAHDDADRARGDLEETSLQLDKLLGAGDPAERLEDRKRIYQGLVAERDEAQRRADQIRRDHDQAIRDEQEMQKALDELRMRLADLAARLEIELEIGADPVALAATLETLRTRRSERTAELRDRLGSAERELEAVTGERSRLRESAGIDGDVTAAVAVVTDRAHRLEKAVSADEEELAKGGALDEERESLQCRAGVFSQISRDLTDSRFVRFLLDDERTRLAELGSEHFQRLSAGRYRFADDQFAILDLAAGDSIRRADSLSGGETFLASLGLALALAEMVAGTGGRLDAFFLDEGFGTLDPQHLDLAMEGVESLVADYADRLVVIVSHVPELRERIEDLIELERSPVTGDTRVIAQ